MLFIILKHRLTYNQRLCARLVLLRFAAGLWKSFGGETPFRIRRGDRTGRHRREVRWQGAAQNTRANEEERVRWVFIEKLDVA